MMNKNLKPQAERAVVLRTKMSIFISILVWGASAFLLADAVFAKGIAALWHYGPFMLFISVLNWVFMYGPHVKVGKAEVVINNIFHSYRASYAAVEKVNIGAMISILARTLSGTTRRVTAWNAPGLKRDNFSDKITSHNGLVASRKARAAGESSGPAPRLSAEARLARDQRAAESYVLYERWENYLAKAPLATNEVLEVKYNWLSIVLLLAATGLLLLRIFLS